MCNKFKMARVPSFGSVHLLFIFKIVSVWFILLAGRSHLRVPTIASPTTRLGWRHDIGDQSGVFKVGGSSSSK